MKKAASGSGSIRKRPDGTWEGRYYDPSGKRHSVYGKTQKEVVERIREIEQQLSNGNYTAPNKITVEEWMNRWLESYVSMQDGHPLTPKTYRTRAKHIIDRLGRIRLSELKPVTVQNFYGELTDKDGLSPKTVRCIHGVFHAALRQAVLNRLISENPAENCVLRKAQDKEIVPLTEEQVRQLLAELEKGEPLKNMILLALFTGMREAEICGLSWDSVNMERAALTVKQQLQKVPGADGRSVFRINPFTKNGKSRILTLPEMVLDILREEQRKQAEAQEYAGSAWDNPWNLVFTNAVGGYICPQTVLKHFKAVCKKIGAENARFHDLRHTYAVLSLQEGDSPKTVQENLGHATAAFTLDRYGHASEKMKRDSADRMQKFYERTKPESDDASD